MNTSTNLSNMLLVSNNKSSFITDAVVLLVSHNKEGALGFVINHSIGHVKFSEILRVANISSSIIDYSNSANLLSGGIWNKEKIFVIHSNDYTKDVLISLNNDLLISSNKEIIKEIARGKGPKQKILLSGISKWMPGELEKDLNDNNWMLAHPNPEVIFSEDIENKLLQILALNKVSPILYMNQTGYC